MNTESRFRLARALAAVVRFRALPLADWAIRGAEAAEERPLVARLFGFRCPLRVARSPVHRLLFLERERFLHERFLIKGLLQPRSVVVDVGANIGYLSLLFERCIGPEGRLICIEPDPDNFSELERCMSVNRFQNTRLIGAAAGDEERTVCLKPGLNGHVVDQGGCQVQQITLDSLVDEKPDFIKIDVEGYEDVVLRGAGQLLRTLRPTLFVEMHPYLVHSRPVLWRLAKELKEIYGRIEYHEYRVPATATGKFAVRYGICSPVSQITDESGLYGAIEEGRRNQPFWAVCRRHACPREDQ